MAKVSEEKPRLFHYTTASGLLGIIESQQIHATSIKYLNDSKEQVGYLKHRLPNLLYSSVVDVLQSHGESAPAVAVLSTDKIEEQAREIAERLVVSILDLSAKLDDPYIASFSAPPERDSDDGLLSQWRAYGADGGYAIVFDTAGIERLLDMDCAARHHQSLLISDVEYYENSSYGGPRLPETLELERRIQLAVQGFIRSNSSVALEPMYEPLMQLSVTSKHHGFSEESEVRIVALRSVPHVLEVVRLDGELRPQHELFFRHRDGLLIPYLNCLDQTSCQTMHCYR